ncbi:copper transport protein [Devosia crocina]|uniref:Copper transport protein n=1 Tax=Devosia crocina TaxID=429728 RepID=A0A1I7NRR7_9HYPH|nr:copper resistance protein CopC [Devosia crocina]SFV37359.1 copper transport protein [Devosia crocina]
MRSLTRCRLLASLVLCLVLVAIAPAFAHAQLLSTQPSEDVVLEVAPAAIDLNFNEPVTPLTIRLIGPDGGARDLTEETTGGTTTTVTLPAGIADGTHVLSWRVVSADGHPIGGSLIFSVGAVTGAAAVEMASDPAVSFALWATKALLFMALFAGVGGAAFKSIAPLPVRAGFAALTLAIAGAVIAPTTLLLQGLDALGLTMASAFDADTWAAGLSTSYGATVIATSLAFLLAVYALVSTAPWAGYIGLAASAIAALSLALSGHASAAEPQWLTRPAVFLHVAGILLWAGALLPLWHLLRDRSNAAGQSLAAFSKIIPFAVAPLVLSGAALAVIQLGPPGERWWSPYGLILGAKLLLVATLLGLALWNRLWLTAPALSGETSAQSNLRRSIGVELLIIVLILALVAGWRFTPPPRALAPMTAATVAADPIVEHLIDGSTMAMVMIDPGSVGTVSFQVTILDLEHNPKGAQAVSVIIANSQLGIESIRREAVETDGIWAIHDFAIPVAGHWQIEVGVRVTRFELARLRGEIAIP